MKRLLIGLLLLGSQVIMQAVAPSSGAASVDQQNKNEQMIEVKVGAYSFNVPENLLSYFQMLAGFMQDFPGQTIELPENKVSPAALEQLIQIVALAGQMQDSDKISLDLADAIKTDEPKRLTQLLQAADFLSMKEPILDALVLKIPQSFYDEDELDKLVWDRGEILKRLAVEIAHSGADAHQVKQLIDNAGKPAQDLFPYLAKPWWLAHNKQLPKFLKDIPFGVSVQYLIDHGLVPDVEYTQYAPFLTLRMLDLSNHRLNNLDGLQKIEGIKGIQSLDLHRNHLERIEPGAFAGLDNLVELWLEKNQLKHINSEAFGGLNKLEILFLHRNQLERIEPRAFAGLNKLEILDLRRNPLEHIEPRTFAGLVNLERLWLNNNQLSCENIAAIERELSEGIRERAAPQQAQSAAASSQ